MNAADRWPALKDGRADEFRGMLDDAAGLTPAQLLDAACAAGRMGNFDVALIILRLVEIDVRGLRTVYEAGRDGRLPPSR